MNNHPERIELHDEIHNRPRPAVAAPVLVSHISLLRPGLGQPQGPSRLADWCRHHGIEPPQPQDRHFSIRHEGHRLKWERHGEFDDYTLYFDAPDPSAPFRDRSGQAILAELASDPASPLMAALRVAVVPASAVAVSPRVDLVVASALLGTTDLVGARISDGAATLLTGFRLDADGFGRFLLVNSTASPTQLGRSVQRVIEIEVYRMMAMLAFPQARRTAGELDAIDARLANLVSRLDVAPMSEEPEMLREVTRLSAMVERLSSDGAFRFGAARAYRSLVRQRGEEMREERLHGLQPPSAFLERRFQPAMAYCDSVASRVDATASRIARASGLLRTRVETEREQQNQALLGALNQRATLQLRLQQTVEGLSVAAITYYGVGLVAYLAKAAERAGLPIEAELATGLAVIPVAIGVALAVRAVRRALERPGRDALG